MNKKIIQNLINAGLAGALVFVGNLIAGQITWEGICAAGLASLVIFLTTFKEFWEKFMKGKKGKSHLWIGEFIKL